MSRVLPVTIAARNEERSLPACLESIAAAARFLFDARGVRCDVVVVADDCSDDTEAVARRHGARVVRSTGGKVEAQRRGARGPDVDVFVDADVTLTEETLDALDEAMQRDPRVQVATPRRLPMPPRRASALAASLHVYNRERGFSSQRTWFNGKCFAIRGFSVPTRAETMPRARALPHDRFYDYRDGIRADDIYLSRSIVHAHGPSALVETARGAVHFRAPETLGGMYRTYRRMRMELERVSALFPELAPAHARHGTRTPDRLAQARWQERLAYHHFTAALALCRVGYRCERAYWRHLASDTCPAWPAIEETKA